MKFKLSSLLIIIAFSCSSCYSSRFVADPDCDSVIKQDTIHWTFLWGLLEQNPISIDCDEEAMSNVTVKDHLLANLLNVATFGLVNPIKLEWCCAPEETPVDDTIPDND